MDEYYARDEADLSQEDLELRGRRKRRIGTVLLVLGFLAAAAALILTASNYRDDIEAGKSALADLHKMEEMLGIDADGDGLIGSTPIEDYYKAHGMDASERSSVRQEDVKNAPVYELHPDMTMPTVDADGHTYVGFLEIPAIKRILPVMDAWSYPNLKIAPCRFVGTVYAHDMIVCAHNYDRHFGLIKTLEEGDKVFFTDVYGDRFSYEVSEVTILQPTDVDEMKDPDDWDLTLFTCTIGGATRVTVRCVMTGSEAAEWTSAAKEDLSEKIGEIQKQSEMKSS
jgi:sortase A